MQGNHALLMETIDFAQTSRLQPGTDPSPGGSGSQPYEGIIECSHVGQMSGTVLGNPGATDGVGIRAEPDAFGWLVIDHMTNTSPTAGDIGDTHEGLGSG